MNSIKNKKTENSEQIIQELQEEIEEQRLIIANYEIYKDQLYSQMEKYVEIIDYSMKLLFKLNQFMKQKSQEALENSRVQLSKLSFEEQQLFSKINGLYTLQEPCVGNLKRVEEYQIEAEDTQPSIISKIQEVAKIAVDNIKVFGFNCAQHEKLKFYLVEKLANLGQIADPHRHLLSQPQKEMPMGSFVIEQSQPQGASNEMWLDVVSKLVQYCSHLQSEQKNDKYKTKCEGERNDSELFKAQQNSKAFHDRSMSREFQDRLLEEKIFSIFDRHHQSDLQLKENLQHRIRQEQFKMISSSNSSWIQNIPGRPSVDSSIVDNFKHQRGRGGYIQQEKMYSDESDSPIRGVSPDFVGQLKQLREREAEKVKARATRDSLNLGKPNILNKFLLQQEENKSKKRDILQEKEREKKEDLEKQPISLFIQGNQIIASETQLNAEGNKQLISQQNDESQDDKSIINSNTPNQQQEREEQEKRAPAGRPLAEKLCKQEEKVEDRCFSLNVIDFKKKQRKDFMQNDEVEPKITKQDASELSTNSYQLEKVSEQLQSVEQLQSAGQLQSVGQLLPVEQFSNQFRTDALSSGQANSQQSSQRVEQQDLITDYPLKQFYHATSSASNSQQTQNSKTDEIKQEQKLNVQSQGQHLNYQTHENSKVAQQFPQHIKPEANNLIGDQITLLTPQVPSSRNKDYQSLKSNQTTSSNQDFEINYKIEVRPPAQGNRNKGLFDVSETTENINQNTNIFPCTKNQKEQSAKPNIEIVSTQQISKQEEGKWEEDSEIEEEERPSHSHNKVFTQSATSPVPVSISNRILYDVSKEKKSENSTMGLQSTQLTHFSYFKSGSQQINPKGSMLHNDIHNKFDQIASNQQSLSNLSRGNSKGFISSDSSRGQAFEIPQKYSLGLLQNPSAQVLATESNENQKYQSKGVASNLQHDSIGSKGYQLDNINQQLDHISLQSQQPGSIYSNQQIQQGEEREPTQTSRQSSTSPLSRSRLSASGLPRRKIFDDVRDNSSRSRFTEKGSQRNSINGGNILALGQQNMMQNNIKIDSLRSNNGSIQDNSYNEEKSQRSLNHDNKSFEDIKSKGLSSKDKENSQFIFKTQQSEQSRSGSFSGQSTPISHDRESQKQGGGNHSHKQQFYTISQLNKISNKQY